MNLQLKSKGLRVATQGLESEVGMPSKAIRVITTGGTIDKVYFDALSEFQVGEPAVEQILEEANVNLPFKVERVCRKDSLDLTDADRAAIFRAIQDCSETHILVTHGTDTMIKTAESVAAIKGKVIVFTGSMAPAKIRNSDAFFNIGGAIIALQTLPPGVYLVINGQVLDPSKSSKNRSLHRFEERN